MADEHDDADLSYPLLKRPKLEPSEETLAEDNDEGIDAVDNKRLIIENEGITEQSDEMGDQQEVEVAEVCEQYTIQREGGEDLEVDVNSQGAVLDVDIETNENNAAVYDESADDGYTVDQEGTTDGYEEGAEEDYDSHCQPVVIQHMDIAQPLSILRRLLEAQLSVSLTDHEFWLQDQYKLDPQLNLTSQCVQGCGQVQVNVEIKTVPGSMPRINITDVLKPADSDDEDMPPSTGKMSAQRAKYKSRNVNRIANRVPRAPMATTTENVTRWIVDQQFRETQMQIEMPLDPLMWNVDHVRMWLTWAVGQFGLDGIDVDSFNMNGQDLCGLEHEHFVQLVPNDIDNVFWTHLELLRKCKFVAVMQPQAAESLEISLAGMRKYGLAGRGNRSGNNGQIQLWQFLLELLTDRNYSQIIEWISDDGEFKLNDAEKVASFWGQRKNKPKMNYEKLSRALRYYYDADMITKVHGKRFTYKFVCDLSAMIGFSPADIRQLVDLATQEVELGATGLAEPDSACSKLETLRELLRTPGGVRRPPNANVMPVVVSAEDLIVDGTS